MISINDKRVFEVHQRLCSSACASGLRVQGRAAEFWNAEFSDFLLVEFSFITQRFYPAFELRDLLNVVPKMNTKAKYLKGTD